MVELLRHRQTKGAATDMFYLTPPRHISTLPFASVWPDHGDFRPNPVNGHFQDRQACLKGAKTGSAHSLYFGCFPLPSVVASSFDAKAFVISARRALRL